MFFSPPVLFSLTAKQLTEFFLFTFENDKIGLADLLRPTVCTCNFIVAVLQCCRSKWDSTLDYCHCQN